MFSVQRCTGKQDFKNRHFVVSEIHWKARSFRIVMSSGLKYIGNQNRCFRFQNTLNIKIFKNRYVFGSKIHWKSRFFKHRYVFGSKKIK